MHVLLSTLSLLAALAAAAAAAPQADASAAAEHHASAKAIAAYLQARLAEGASERGRALDELREALLHDPASATLHVAYAEALSRAGQLELAEREARRALELGPSGAAEADAHLALGKTLVLDGRGPAALPELEQAARLEGALARRAAGAGDPAERRFDPEPWRALSLLRLETGDAAGAAAACEQLAALDPPEGVAALRELAARLAEAKKEEAAERQLRRAVELLPSDAESWKLLARVEEGRGRLAEARAAYERALAAEPDDPDALLGAGALAVRQKDLATGRAWLRQLVRTAPDEVDGRMRVAALWLDAKMPADALEATAGGPEDARLLYLRGLALEGLRRWPEAAAAFADVAPASGELYRSARASLAFALGRAGRHAEAVRALRRGLEAEPRDATLLYALGEAYERAGQRDQALAQMRAVLEVKPDHAEALNFIGYTYAEQGVRLDEAQRLVERALELEPDNGFFLDSLGWVLYRRGEYASSVKTLERADRLAGADAAILDHLGDAYRSAHRPADAAEAYRRALKLASDPGTAEHDPQLRSAVERKLREVGAQKGPAAASR